MYRTFILYDDVLERVVDSFISLKLDGIDLKMMMKRLLSYIWPQTKKISSHYNGMLEITLLDGKKVLDSKGANYSYGSLQQIFENGIDKINLSKVNSVLLLGLGGGCVIDSLRNKFLYQNNITAVELDATIIKIAQEEFGIKTTDNLNIIHQDAFVFVKETVANFDVILVDIFIDQKVPEQFYSDLFCHQIYRILNLNGNIIFNLGMSSLSTDQIAKVTKHFKQKGAKVFVHKNVLETNTLLIVEKG